MLFVDDDGDLRAVLGEVLARICGRELLAAESYDDLLELGERALSCCLAILDINLGAGRPSGIDAYEWLASRGFRGRVAFLTGHGRSHPLVERAFHLRAAVVYQKPISLETLCSLVTAEDVPS